MFLIAFAVMLGALQRVSWRERIVSVVAVVVVALAGGSLVNNYFADYLTVRQLLGLPPTDQVDLTTSDRQGPARRPGRRARPPRRADAGRGRGDHRVDPRHEVRLPARDAVIYLPPAYGRIGAPLPVMVMMAGQPGSPRTG